MTHLKDQIATLSLTLLSKLPLSVLHGLGHLIGLLLYHCHSPLRKVILTNLTLCFKHLKQSDLKQLTREALIENTKLILEMSLIWMRPHYAREHLIRNTSGEDLLQQALTDKRGLILILPHLGNWEITNHYLMQKTPLTALYKPFRLSKVESQVKQSRSLGETQMVPTNQTGVKQLLKTLKQGGVCVILPDQCPPMGNGQFTDFFQKPAYTSPLIPKLLAKTNAQCLCIFAKRLTEHQGFEICIRNCDTALYNTDTDQASLGLNRSIEHCIREAITQYLWSYKRFKIQPEKHIYPYHQ